MVTQRSSPQPIQEWVLLSYRIPREPSTPRIAVWRKLKDLGVVQVGDGLVGLPHDARTREHLDWVAAQVVEAGGEAIVWVATPATRRVSVVLARQMQDARSEEYHALIAEITERGDDADRRTVTRWRRVLRRIDRRDYFRSPGRDRARLEVERAAARHPAVEARR